MHKFTVKSKLKYGKFYLAEKGAARQNPQIYASLGAKT